MAASNSGGGGPLSAEAAAALREGVGLVFARWTALQMAVENQWGGRDSRAKADQLGASIVSWFCHSKGPHYFEDLVDMMYDTISESLNSDFEDGSVEEVAEQLLIMHEECQQSNYSSIEKLRNSHVQGNAFSQSRQIPIGDNDDSDSSDDDDDALMMDDEAIAPEGLADGWTVFPPRRGRGNN
ncbi:hypothetical protein EJB05_03098 [Eragrostis curvula]|uniref:Pre-rRNA-processing protein TSR2 homolog n=1 Tax=Eragrostis curvula TaxID=38414 RepID=A0A5J9WU87_9POAL|nr:hypothetical protein EJB05_03098 [Eragrostis curvula]